MLTADMLADFIDPAIAVDRALNWSERTAFLEYRNVGGVDGPTIAAWISDPISTATSQPHIDKWWTNHGDTALAFLVTTHELPEALIRKLLTYAMYATFAIASATLGAPRRSHIEVAAGAALWARGYAEAMGWQPEQPGSLS